MDSINARDAVVIVHQKEMPRRCLLPMYGGLSDIVPAIVGLLVPVQMPAMFSQQPSAIICCEFYPGPLRAQSFTALTS